MRFLKLIYKRKKIWIPAIILAGLLIYLYNLVFVSDIAFTEPNVNDKKVDSLAIGSTILSNKWADTMTVDSGRLVIKETRSDANSNHIEVSFIRIKSTAEKPLSPIFFLAGGPGSSSTSVATTNYFYLFKELSKYSDIVLMDQRGTGGSIPNLDCRNFLETPKEITTNVQRQILNDLVRKCKECADEFWGMGINLNAYNSAESAKDIDDLRNALGYNKISLYGYSYGTELAQIYIKKFRNRVDKAILAGSLAPDHGLKLPSEADYQFQKMDSLIKLDPKLVKYVPDFARMIKSVHRELQKDPKFIQVKVQDALDDDASFVEKRLVNLVSTVNPHFEMFLTQDHIQMMVADNIGLDRWISKFPSFYYRMSQGEYDEVGLMLRNFSRRRLPNAIFFTVNAASGYSEERWQMSQSQSDTSLVSHFGLSYGRYPEVYNAFGVEEINDMNDPVLGDTKVLFIGGSLDGRTPPNLTDVLTRRFPNHYRIMVHNAGHNNLLNEDIKDEIILFLQDSLKANINTQVKLEFDNPVPYQFDISEIIKTTLDTQGVNETIKFYDELYDEFINVEDYVYEFKANPFYNVVDKLIEDQNYIDAITLLEYVITKYPEDNYLYVYLSLAYQKSGDKTNAKKNAETAQKLDYFDGNAHIILNQLNN